MTVLELTNLTSLKDWVLLIVGNIFIIIVVVRGVTYWAQREWGQLVGHFIGAVLLAGFVYFPNFSIEVLKKLFELVFK